MDCPLRRVGYLLPRSGLHDPAGRLLVPLWEAILWALDAAIGAGILTAAWYAIPGPRR